MKCQLNLTSYLVLCNNFGYSFNFLKCFQTISRYLPGGFAGGVGRRRYSYRNCSSQSCVLPARLSRCLNGHRDYVWWEQWCFHIQRSVFTTFILISIVFIFLFYFYLCPPEKVFWCFGFCYFSACMSPEIHTEMLAWWLCRILLVCRGVVLQVLCWQSAATGLHSARCRYP